MSTTSVGRGAEDRVADMLRKSGHKIIQQNWRTRWCEIDIVSIKRKVVYFTEVKYRGSDDWGGGLEYITPRKLQQMRFAAEFWLAQEDWRGEVCLQAAEVGGVGEINLIEL